MIKYRTKLILLLFIPLSMLSCGEDNVFQNNSNCLSGSGVTITETREFDSFNAISAAIVGNVIITQGTPQSVRIETHPNVMAELQTEVIDNELIIDFDRCQNDIETLNISITMSQVSSLSLSGVGDISSSNAITSDDLSVSLSGVGNIHLNGEVDQFDCLLSGVGDLRAFDLTTNDCKIVISGVGDAEVTASNSLDAIISGVGDVRYKGNPTINSSISGTGNVIDAN